MLFAVLCAVVTDTMQSLHCFSQKNKWDKIVITFIYVGTFIQVPLHSQNTLLAKRKSKSHQAHLVQEDLHKNGRGRGVGGSALFNDTANNC
jgi:hypothetical protein